MVAMVTYPNLNALYLSPRLRARLAQIPQHGITTIVAPTGYGKTTAASWWQTHCPRGALVLRQIVTGPSLSEFWLGLCRTLGIAPTLAQQLEALRFPTDGVAQELLAQMLQQLLQGSQRPVYYILDDLHFLPEGQLTPILLFLAHQLPEQVHLVLLSRNQIFFEADRLRLGRRLNQITAEDLRLQQQEVEQYAQACGLSLTPEQSRALQERCEGWISLIYLHFRAFAQRSDLQLDTHDIFELMEQVMLQPLSPREQDFLVCNSICDGLTLAKAEAVWGQPDAAKLLRTLSRNNAFISRSLEGVYRYHHMLQKCTRTRFAALPAAEQAAVWRRLGRWHLKNESYLAAEQAFSRAQDWSGFLRALELDCGKSVSAEQKPMLMQLCTQCPPEVLQENPQAILVLMRKLFSFREIDRMLQLKALFEAALDRCQDYTAQQRRNAQGELELVLSFLRYNDISAMSVHHRAAAELMNRPSRCIDPAGTWTFGSPSIAAMFHRQAGALDRENAEMRTCMPYYSRVVRGHGSGADVVMQGETELLRGQTDDALISYHRARQLALDYNQASILVTAEFLGMQLDLYTGSAAQMEQRLERLHRYLVEQNQLILLVTVDLCRAWLFALQGRSASIPQWVLAPDAASMVMYPAAPMLQMTVNQALLATKRWPQLLARAEMLEGLADASHTLLCGIYYSLQLAAAAEHLGQHTRAADYVRQAVALAQPDGLILPFAQADSCLHPYLRAARELWPALAQTSQLQPRQAAPPHNLTRRELEVARLAAQRQSTQEIAAQLHLSPATVKNHLNHVFDKLQIPGTARNKRAVLQSRLDAEKDST